MGGTFLVSRLFPSLKATVGAAGTGSAVTAPGPIGQALQAASHTVTVPLRALLSASLFALAIGLALAGGVLAGLLGGWLAGGPPPSGGGAAAGGMSSPGEANDVRATRPTREKGPQMYELRKVTKLYRKGRAAIKALDDVSLSLAQGEFLAIQGPTGQGKTTLLQLLGALVAPRPAPCCSRAGTSLGCERGRSPR